MSDVRRFVAADRFVDAQLWWVASELCRRHPRLRMREIEHGEIGTFLEVVAWLEPVLAWPSIPELRERWALDAAHDALYQKAPAHAWLLMRDLEPVAVFDLYGRVHTETGVADLYGAHREAGSNL